MSNSALAKKMLIKPGHRVLLLNASAAQEKLLRPLPEGAEIVTAARGSFDCVIVFVESVAELDRHAAKALKALKYDGLLWMAYPKKTSKIKTDISRDQGWDVIVKTGLEGVAAISIDDVWSGMRFRPSELVKTARAR